MSNKVAIGAAIAAGILWLRARKPAGGADGGAELEIRILDSTGNLILAQEIASMAAIVPWDFGGGVPEGGEYILRAIVTNRSTRAGAPWAASLRVRHIVTGGGATLKDLVQTLNFVAGEAKQIDVPFIVPVGIGGQPASARVDVLTPDGLTNLASQTKAFTITVVAIIYAADVVVAAV